MARHTVAGPTAIPGLSEMSVLNSLPVGVVVLDRDMRCMAINNRATELSVRRTGDHIGRLVADVLPDIFPHIESYCRQVLLTGQAVEQTEFQAMTPAHPDELRWWSADYSPVLDSEGHAVAVSVMFRDVTERAIGRARAQVAFRRLKSVLDIVPVGVVIANDKEYESVEINAVARKMWRLAPSDTFKQTIKDRRHYKVLLDGAEFSGSEGPLAKAVTRGEETHGARMDIFFSDGMRRHILAWAAPLYTDTAWDGAVAAYFDISELVETQEELRAASRVKDDFLAMVSHELRTPMTMILGNAQLLARPNGTFPAEDSRFLATDVYREALNLTRIVENLLLMTRMDRGDRLELEPTVLNRVCQDVVGEMPEDVRSRIRLNFPQGPFIAQANAGSVRQVMYNLISNALKYSPPAGSIELSFDCTESEVVFSVADRGAGVSFEEQELIFEPFYRSASTAERSGMGIGLAVSKQLVSAMGGRIWAESRMDGGSVFSFALQRVEAEAD
jgi:signal transduction histidine kinase